MPMLFRPLHWDWNIGRCRHCLHPWLVLLVGDVQELQDKSSEFATQEAELTLPDLPHVRKHQDIQA